MYGQNSYSQYPYGGYGYPNYGQRNYMQPQQPMTQPQIQQAQQMPMPYETPIQDIRLATSEEAKAFIVMPNTKALLIDLKGGMAHLKSADNMGQSVTEYFKFEKVNSDGTPIKQQEPIQQADPDKFVKKEDLENLNLIQQKKFEELFKEMQNMQTQINALNKPKISERPVVKTE